MNNAYIRVCIWSVTHRLIMKPTNKFLQSRIVREHTGRTFTKMNLHYCVLQNVATQTNQLNAASYIDMVPTDPQQCQT